MCAQDKCIAYVVNLYDRMPPSRKWDGDAPTATKKKIADRVEDKYFGVIASSLQTCRQSWWHPPRI